MLVNEYVNRFTQLSRYAPNEVDTNEKEYFLNGLNDGLTYALEAQDFKNFQGMVNMALVLENCRGVMERKRKLVRQHQPCNSSRPRVASSSLGLCSTLLNHSFSRDLGQLDKDYLPNNTK
jgi:hypothetical protein